LDDDDARRIQALVPQARYQKISANHVIHFYKPQEFEDAVAILLLAEHGV